MSAAARYLALGDSYTIGEGVAAADRWPERLAAVLGERGTPVAPPEFVARSGWTCAELDAGITAAGLRGPVALVSLLIGVNDQFRGGSAAAYAPAFGALLERAVRFAGGRAGRVLVLSIPDWSVTPFAAGRDRAAIAQAVSAFNGVNRAAAAGAGARYVDIAPESRRTGADPALFTDDGLHPAAATYDAWARLALPAAAAALAGG
ncbi:MAG: SGNH/GDSL hydrolase family protein [Gemmatimonadota bacterium]|nr:SGNH/GDSL hydrolase family protein [Gemmatimonadota bacterium]